MKEEMTKQVEILKGKLKANLPKNVKESIQSKIDLLNGNKTVLK